MAQGNLQAADQKNGSGGVSVASNCAGNRFTWNGKNLSLEVLDKLLEVT